MTRRQKVALEEIRFYVGGSGWQEGFILLNPQEH
jgi:hypothetical protein